MYNTPFHSKLTLAKIAASCLKSAAAAAAAATLLAEDVVMVLIATSIPRQYPRRTFKNASRGAHEVVRMNKYRSVSSSNKFQPLLSLYH